MKKPLLKKPSKKLLIHGKVIRQPMNILLYVVIGIFIIFFIACWFFIKFPKRIRIDQVFEIFIGMLSPRKGKTWADYFKYFANKEMWNNIRTTLEMCFIGTLVGSLFSLPVAILTSRNIVKNKFVVYFIRVFLTFVRSIPINIIALIALFLAGIGIFSGTVAISVFTFGIMSKMLYESIETLDMGSYEAVISTGTSSFFAVRRATIPQILPLYIGYTVYAFEMNFRASIILGLVGAGGIGLLLDNNIKERYYDRVGVIVFIFMVIVLLLQLLTRLINKKLR
ncbi:MAG: ABC transporter permease subunit [Acholeplasmatales bacterium]|jgi:phosphonate transport system permease protein|nr:ABC transporter permease subunit [Acholeplasmatales bacterium]